MKGWLDYIIIKPVMEVEAFDSMDARNVQGGVYEPTLSITVREEIVILYNYGLQTSDISRKYREFSCRQS